jgi:hypothetical protein
LLSRPAYRARQFFGALWAEVSASEREAARNALGEGLYPLFESMQAADQRHCVDVFESLLRTGHTDEAMLQAALIHDCGKGRFSGAELRTWHRVAWVLVYPLGPVREIAARLSPGMGALLYHAELALSLARAHGASPDVLHLLEEMERPSPGDERGRALKAADESA